MKRKILIAGAAFFAALFVISAGMLYWQYADGRQSAEIFDRVSALIPDESPRQESSPEPDGETESSQGMTSAEKYADVFAENPDCIGWLRIDGTNIDFPVMHTPDDSDYYLKRGFDKQYSNYGTPYMQANCDLETSDNLIIYGHHMVDGAMFRDLTYYEDGDFYKEHQIIHFDTKLDYGEYEVIAVFKTVAYSDDGFKYYKFTDAEHWTEFDSFIAECKALQLYETGLRAEYGDKLLTLSTCEYSRDNGRLVVLAKKIASPSAEVDEDA